MQESYTFKVPQLNWQIIALGLIAVIAAVQTVELVSLRKQVSAAPVSIGASAGGSTPASSAGPAMVGGC